jgi:phosphoglycolate phosphatase
MHLRAALFDLDGTLLDSLADIATAMNHALALHGLPGHRLPAYQRFVGEGVKVLVQRAVPAGRESLQAPVLAAYQERYAQCLLEQTRTFPGIPSMLERLAAEGLKLAVLSNKPDDSTRKLVDALLPGIPFGVVYGERAGVPRKPDPTAALGVAAELGVPPEACAFVGDTPIDMGTARAAGMYAVGVTWGFRSVEELQAHGVQALASTADELLELLLRRAPGPVTRP